MPDEKPRRRKKENNMFNTKWQRLAELFKTEKFAF